MRRIAGFLLAFAAPVLPAMAFGQTESVVYNFCSTHTSSVACTDGEMPNQGLLQGPDGNFYGVTSAGGANGAGTVFRLSYGGALTTLYSFCSAANCADGSTPSSPLVLGPDGNFYGATLGGGTSTDGTDDCNNGCGVIYRLTPAGTESIVYNFCQLVACRDGQQPGPFVFGSDGNIYGVTSAGGPPYTSCEFGCGEVYELTTGGTLSQVYGFSGLTTDGQYPSGIVQGLDGNLYGAAQGGAHGAGVIFKIVFGATGALTQIYNFCSTSGCPDGENPAGLVQGADGYLYGGAMSGGAHAEGTLFKVSTSGTFSTLYSFCATSGCGEQVVSPLFAAGDGNFYGTTPVGGNTNATICPSGCGVLFELSSGGSYSEIRAFNPANHDAAQPAGPLMQSSTGNFYGTGSKGGNGADCAAATGCGAIYEVQPEAGIVPPVEVTFSPTSINLGGSSTLTWTANNAFSGTLQQCYLYSTSGTAFTALGKLNGSYNSNTHVYTGSTSVTPSATGNFTYGVTCGGAESGLNALTVNPYATTTTLTYAPNPLSVGQTATLTATVAHSSGTVAPTGKVTFSVGSTTIGSGTLNSSGVATLSASTNGLAPGTYPVVATYSGDSNYAASQSAAKDVVLNSAATSTTVTASPNPVAPPATCTLTATVKRTASGAAGYATGTVTFSVGTVTLGTAAVGSTGVARLSASTNGVPAGTYPVTAKYNGDSADSASSGNVSVQVE